MRVSQRSDLQGGIISLSARPEAGWQCARRAAEEPRLVSLHVVRLRRVVRWYLAMRSAMKPDAFIRCTRAAAPAAAVVASLMPPVEKKQP